MTTPLLSYTPEKDNYQFVPGYGVVSTKLDGGASRMRLDVVGCAHTVQMQWVLKSADYALFMGFFRTTLVEGTLPFLVNLLADCSLPTLHKARCLNGIMPYLSANSGDAFYIKGAFEVEANPTVTDALTFAMNLPSTQASVECSPHDMSAFQIGDNFQIIGATSSTLNFDGVYPVTAKPSATKLTSAGAQLLNSSWNLINTSAIAITCTITKVPT